jgi:hypothetical protein
MLTYNSSRIKTVKNCQYFIDEIFYKKCLLTKMKKFEINLNSK